MKFTPKYIDQNVNVSKTHPLVEMAWLIGGLLVLVVVLYLILGFTAELAVTKIPIRAELQLGEYFADNFDSVDNPALQQRLQQLLETLPTESPLHQYDFIVQLVESDEINALALPGGHIVVFSGLLEQVASENELALVLAHELGHFAHRDHLRRLGRGLGLTLGAMLLFGEDSSAGRLATNLLLVSESRYSRQQESDADRWGLELLVACYGHAGGATDFFRRAARDAGSHIPYLMASHPHPDDRVRELQALIAAKGYPVAITESLREDLLTVGSEE